MPKNVKKYIGDVSSITCRSLWERHVCKFLDESDSILKWSSEEIVIPYLNPIDKKIHNYYPDFLVEMRTESNEKEVWLLEVKPKKQTFLKENASKREIVTWTINTAKWKAAESYCIKHGIKFKIMTEKDLFSSNTKS